MAFGPALRLNHMRSRTPLRTRRQRSPKAKTFDAALFSNACATSRFSFVFSASSVRKRLASDTSMPTWRAVHLYDPVSPTPCFVHTSAAFILTVCAVRTAMTGSPVNRDLRVVPLFPGGLCIFTVEPAGRPSGALGCRVRMLGLVGLAQRLSARRFVPKEQCLASDHRIMNTLAGSRSAMEIRTLFVSRYSLMASIPLSRPMPDRFVPPKGTMWL